jgi:hypothetical protein
MLWKRNSVHEHSRGSVKVTQNEFFIASVFKASFFHPARKAFIAQQTTSTLKHSTALERAIGVNRRQHDRHINDDDVEQRFKQVENEWLARREELLEARAELARRDKERVERLVAHARSVGVPPVLGGSQSPSRIRHQRMNEGVSEGEIHQTSKGISGIGGGDESGGAELRDYEKSTELVDRSIRLPTATESLRRAMSPDRGVQRAEDGQESPRAWSPELIEESRFRKVELPSPFLGNNIEETSAFFQSPIHQ